MYDNYYKNNSRVDAVTEKAMGARIDMEDEGAYQELVDDYFEGKDNLREEFYASVKLTTDSLVDQIISEDVMIYLSSITNDATILYDPSETAFVYRCSCVLTAMYMMTFVADFNQDEYRECARENCHQYFKVDKSHPQTLCDRHMAARRKKRQNQLKYAKEETAYK